jgi:hypothetical protein
VLGGSQSADTFTAVLAAQLLNALVSQARVTGRKSCQPSLRCWQGCRPARAVAAWVLQHKQARIAQFGHAHPNAAAEWALLAQVLVEAGERNPPLWRSMPT